MYITVFDILKLSSFQAAQVIAGSNGLYRKVERVSVPECPEFPIDPEMSGKSNQLFADGDFLVSSFYAIKDTPELLLDTIKLYNQFNSSGLVIIKRYFKEIPQDVLDYANNNNYPLIILDKTIAYADIINDIMKAIFVRQNMYTYSYIIDQILADNYTDKQLEGLVYTLNPKFNTYLITFYIQLLDIASDKLNLLTKDINENALLFSINYYNSILVFATLKEKHTTNIIDILKTHIQQTLVKYHKKYFIGVSNNHEGLKNIKTSIIQSMIACKVCRIKNLNVEEYKNIGTYKLLLEIQDISLLKRFYNELIIHIQKYDEEKNGDLLNTMLCYVENDANIKKTAKQLHQHENTIRYRLIKIKQLLNTEDNNIKFYENLAIAYKIHKILTET